MQTLKILSWNVNGIRAIERKDFIPELFSYNADIICIQETKAEREQLSTGLVEPEGYTSWFHSTSQRKGHSGTAIYSRIEPSQVKNGFPAPWTSLDEQGRTMTIFFDDFETPTAIINCYFPNGGSKSSPLDYKLEFYDAMLGYVNRLRDDGYEVIICGDWNIAHTEMDIARAKENEKSIGFLPEERAWLDRFHTEGWVDVWRYANPDTLDTYTWWDMKSGARDRNVGWRIDYFFVDEPLLERVADIQIVGNQFGSDHCPMMMEIVVESEE